MKLSSFLLAICLSAPIIRADDTAPLPTNGDTNSKEDSKSDDNLIKNDNNEQQGKDNEADKGGQDKEDPK